MFREIAVVAPLIPGQPGNQLPVGDVDGGILDAGREGPVEALPFRNGVIIIGYSKGGRLLVLRQFIDLITGVFHKSFGKRSGRRGIGLSVPVKDRQGVILHPKDIQSVLAQRGLGAGRRFGGLPGRLEGKATGNDRLFRISGGGDRLLNFSPFAGGSKNKGCRQE